MTLAAVDLFVHHSTILEMNVESLCRKAALDQKRGRGRPPDDQENRTGKIRLTRHVNPNIC